MKQFDWNFYATEHNEQKTLWLKLNHNKKITEDEYVKAMKNLRQYSKCKKRSSRYSPSNLKYEYNRLVTKFGFFV